VEKKHSRIKRNECEGTKNIHGSKETSPDQIGPGRRGALSGSDRNDEDIHKKKRNMLCQKKHEGKVRNTIGGKQHPVFLFIRICFFSWTVFVLLPCVSFPSQVSGDSGCDDGES